MKIIVDKRVETMPLDMVYLDHDHLILNSNRFINIKGVKFIRQIPNVVTFARSSFGSLKRPLEMYLQLKQLQKSPTPLLHVFFTIYVNL